MSLRGKTLFITGASRGIGLAIGLRAARDGANVVIAAKTAEPHKKLPGTKIIFLAIKPSPSRAHLLDKYKAANAQIAAIAGEKHFTFVDVATPMLGEDGQPRGELFREDRLHMNEKGYALWTQILRPYLEH